MNIKPRAVINDILPYRPGKPVAEVQRELGLDKVVKLASNENALGPSRKAMAAVRAALPDIFQYPESSGYYLVQALAARHGLTVDHFILGNGANDLLELVAKTYVGPGDNVVSGYPSFIMYEITAKLMDAEFRGVPLRDYRFDLEAMAAAVDARTKAVFIANPNNPTGVAVNRGEVEWFLANIPDHVLVVMDEAYFDFVAAADNPDALVYVKQNLPVMAMRSFSKNYGLAGLRLGWAAAAPEIVSPMHRIRQPFNVNALAQVAGLAALADGKHLARSRAMVAEGRLQLYRGLDNLGVKYVRSEANFVLVELGRDAAAVYHELLSLGVVVRPLGGWGLPRAIRVTVGTTAENDAFLQAFAEVLKK